VDLPEQRGRTPFAMLFKSQINRRNRSAVVGDAIDDEPTGQGVTTAAFTGPAQSALHRVVKRVSLQGTVIAGFKFCQEVHALEFAIPVFSPGNGQVHEN